MNDAQLFKLSRRLRKQFRPIALRKIEAEERAVSALTDEEQQVIDERFSDKDAP
jgi:hypothetical protein